MHGCSRSHGSPTEWALASFSQIRTVPWLSSNRQRVPRGLPSPFVAAETAIGKSGDQSTHKRSTWTAPFTTRGPQMNPGSDAVGGAPAGGSPPRQKTAPAISAHSHSPASGMRGRRCSHRAPAHRNSSAPSARSTHTLRAPGPAHRKPSRESATWGTARAVTAMPAIAPAPAPAPAPQQTRRSPTSLHRAAPSFMGDGHSVRTTTFACLSFSAHADKSPKRARTRARGRHGGLTERHDAAVAWRAKGLRHRARGQRRSRETHPAARDGIRKRMEGASS